MSSAVPSRPSGPGVTMTLGLVGSSSAVFTRPSGPGSNKGCGPPRKMPPSLTLRICAQVSTPVAREVKTLSMASAAFCLAIRSDCELEIVSIPSERTAARLNTPIASTAIAIIVSISVNPYCGCRKSLAGMVSSFGLIDPLGPVPAIATHSSGRAQGGDSTSSFRAAWNANEDRAVQRAAGGIDERAVAQEGQRRRSAEANCGAVSETVGSIRQPREERELNPAGQRNRGKVRGRRRIHLQSAELDLIRTKEEDLKIASLGKGRFSPRTHLRHHLVHRRVSPHVGHGASTIKNGYSNHNRQETNDYEQFDQTETCIAAPV